MGIIERQSLKGTIFTYIGVVIGFINTGLIFPKILLTEQIGLLSILISYSLVFSQIASLGFNSATIRLFPYFRNKEKKDNGFLFLSLAVAFVGFLLVFLIFLAVKPLIINNPNDSSVLLKEFGIYIVPLAFFTLFFNSLDVYKRMLYKTVIGTFLREFLVRFLVFIDIIFFYLNIISFDRFVIFYVIIYCTPAVVLVIQLIKDKQFNLKPNLKFINKELRKSLISVSSFGIIGGFAGIAVANIDKIMISQMLGLNETGVYTIAFYFGSLIIIPSRSLIKISSTLIADAWRQNDLKTISSIYNKSVINQVVIGLLLFIGIVGNINNIFEILPEQYSTGKYIIIFISLSFLVDMSTGVSGNIIGSSKSYKVQAYFMLLLIILLFITNLMLIPKYGMVGAAVASLLSKIVINLLKVSFIYYKFRLFPYTFKVLLAILIGLITYFSTNILPIADNLYVDIFYRSSIMCIIFILLIYLFKVSVEINNKLESIYSIIIRKL